MANTANFRVDTPTTGDDPREGDDRIRETKAAILERMRNAGCYWDDETAPPQPDLTSGMPVVGQQVGLTASPLPTVAPTADQFIRYESDKDTPASTLDQATKTLTLGDGRSGTNDYTINTQTLKANDLDIRVNGTIVSLPQDGIYTVNKHAATTGQTITGSFVELVETVTMTTHLHSSKTMVVWSGAHVHYDPLNTGSKLTFDYQLWRDGAVIAGTPQASYHVVIPANNDATLIMFPVSIAFLDDTTSPDTTYVYTIAVGMTEAAGPADTISMSGNRQLICTEYVWI